MSRSLLWWFSKLPRWSKVSSQRRSDTPASQPLAEAVSTKPPAMTNGTESDLIDTPPPSYEDACPGLVETDIKARNETMKEPRLVLQDDRRSKTVICSGMTILLRGL
ncbi:uncharacterized protein PG998_008367 [Apiospora kogelbergensis]|uniref:uncharacterized protein n=1 Tax=Apiospora kogelbergensis TaxID=1337665 RepID=UPI00312D36C1